MAFPTWPITASVAIVHQTLMRETVRANTEGSAIRRYRIVPTCILMNLFVGEAALPADFHDISGYHRLKRQRRQSFD